MPPRHHTLPQPTTSSARLASQSFFCTLCAKGYARMNDYEAHLSSYDHAHKQRLKDMKSMVRDPGAAERARRAEAREGGIVSIKMPGEGQGGKGAGGGAGGGGFKKGGFKKSGFKSAFAPVEGAEGVKKDEDEGKGLEREKVKSALIVEESDTEDEGYQVYDPRFPTD